MDPVALATITAGVSVLASECAKGVASHAGKDLWAKVKSLLGWGTEPKLDELAPLLAKQLYSDKELTTKIVTLLQQSENGSFAGMLVGKIDAEKVVVSQTIYVSGDFNM